jgi:hypothetical protein
VVEAAFAIILQNATHVLARVRSLSMRNPPLTENQIKEKLTNENLDELLHLWWTEQGAAKRRDLDLIASAIHSSPNESLLVLDLCCGPGDVGRAIRARYSSPDPRSLSEQSQSLLVTHRLPRDKFLGKHIHSSKEGQLEEKSHKIQVAEH